MKKKKVVEKRSLKPVNNPKAAKPRKKVEEEVAPADHREYMLF